MMNQKTKLVVVGLGGVGGYFGGLLAKHYQESPTVEVVFVARGEHLKQIQTNGLRVVHNNTYFTAHPALATNNIAEIGTADYILLCTKSYDLEATIAQLKPCIATHTLVLPLLNGVDSTQRIKQLLPHTTVLQGCVYIVSRLKEAGVVENSGTLQAIYFGSEQEQDERLQQLHTLFTSAGIEATLSPDITTKVWEKFIFISPTATATSYFDSSIGKLAAEQEATATKLFREVIQLARAKNISVAPDIEAKVLHRLKTLPYDSTSSMHSDYQSGKGKTELESLTGYVVREAQQLNVDTPTYAHLYAELQKR